VVSEHQKGKGKDKDHPTRSHEAPEGEKTYSSTDFIVSRYILIN